MEVERLNTRQTQRGGKGEKQQRLVRNHVDCAECMRDYTTGRRTRARGLTTRARGTSSMLYGEQNQVEVFFRPIFPMSKSVEFQHHFTDSLLHTFLWFITKHTVKHDCVFYDKNKASPTELPDEPDSVWQRLVSNHQPAAVELISYSRLPPLYTLMPHTAATVPDHRAAGPRYARFRG